MSSSSSHAHPLPSTNPFYNTLKIVPSKSVPSQTLPLRSALPTFSESIPVNNFSPGWQAAQNSVLKQMVTSEFFDSPASTPIETPTRGRGGQRGRPSTARRVRGRAPKAKADSQESAGTTSDTGTPTERGTGSGRSRGRGRGRGGGRPRVRRAGGPGRGTKRKREDSDEEGDEELGKDDTDASETFTPLPAQSRSGRKISKATYFSPVAKQSTGEQPLSGSGATKGKKGQKNQQKPVQTSVCRNCGRGPSPGKNMIVYCTGCNTPWHQHCHDPPITTEVVQLEEKEWLCTDCEISREEKVQLVGKVSAEGMSLAEVGLLLSLIFPNFSLSFSPLLTRFLSLYHRNAAIYKASRHLISSFFSYTPAASIRIYPSYPPSPLQRRVQYPQQRKPTIYIPIPIRCRTRKPAMVFRSRPKRTT